MVPQRDAGGDNEVPRADDGRPRIRTNCAECETTGRVPSAKRPGNTVQCPKCKGAGTRDLLYSRTTTYIDVMEDKSNLIAWGKRMVLAGVAMDPTLLDGVLDLDPEVKADKSALIKRAESAATVAGASVKAEKGTYLHGLSELVDRGEELPRETSFADVIDMDAYKRATSMMKIVNMERMVVHDELKIAGTPDRTSLFSGIGPEDKLVNDHYITDLKTGSIEYGTLKMAMQLAVYAHSKLYDHKTHERTDMKVNQDWGIIMHLPAGSGVCTLYWVDLRLGWEAVNVATLIRSLRNRGRKAFTDFVTHDTATEFASPAARVLV